MAAAAEMRKDTQMTDYVVKVTEPALMQLCLMGLESYCVPKRFRETYGLLWGSIAHGGDERTYYRIEQVLTDAEATRGRSSVQYSEENIRLKTEVMESCWPDIAFIGDIHTHPWKDRHDADGGWRLSDGDREDVEESNTAFWRKVGLKLNLVLSIHQLGNAGWAEPKRITENNVELSNTFFWTVKNHARNQSYRLRLAAYVIDQISAGRKKQLFLSPRHNSRIWENSSVQNMNITLPKHTVRLDVPSVPGIRDPQ